MIGDDIKKFSVIEEWLDGTCSVAFIIDNNHILTLSKDIPISTIKLGVALMKYCGFSESYIILHDFIKGKGQLECDIEKELKLRSLVLSDEYNEHFICGTF